MLRTAQKSATYPSGRLGQAGNIRSWRTKWCAGATSHTAEVEYLEDGAIKLHQHAYIEKTPL